MFKIVEGLTVMWTADPTGEITCASSNLQELTGSSQPSPQSLMRSIHPDDLLRVQQEKQTALDDPRPFQSQFKVNTRDGRVLNILAAGHPIYNASGIVLGWLGTWSDITGQAPRVFQSPLSVLKVAPRLVSEQRAVPLVSFDMDGTLCNTYQSWFDAATETAFLDTYDWQDIHCGGSCQICTSSVCLSGNGPKVAGRLSRKEIEHYKQVCLNTPDYYSMIEPFDPSDLELIKYSIEGGRILAGFIATRTKPTSEKGIFAVDADVQSLAWLEGSWASHESRSTYSITGYLGTCFSARDKVRELVHRGVTYHLDDDAATVELLRAADIEAFLIDRPWNRHNDCAWRVESVEQFLDIVAPEFAEVPETAGETMCA